MFRISRCEENVTANTCIHVTFLCCWYISLLFTLERIHASNIGLLTAVKPGNKKAFVFFPKIKQIPKSYCSVEFATKYLLGLGKTLTLNCLKSFCIRSFLVRIFLYSDWIRRDRVSLRTQSECAKIRTTKTPNRGTFYAV